MRPVLHGLEDYTGCRASGDIIFSYHKNNPPRNFIFGSEFDVTFIPIKDFAVVDPRMGIFYFWALGFKDKNYEMIKAKFKVLTITERMGDQKEVHLQPVVSGSEENKTFSTYTPTGELKMTITNPAAMDFFKIGKEYYLDFTPAD